MVTQSQVTLAQPATAAEHTSLTRLLHSRAVVRRYTTEPVSDAQTNELLDAMLAAPTAANKQAWGFVAVRDQYLIRSLRAFSPGMIGTPPLIVVACFDRDRAVRDDSTRYDVGLLCVAMAVQNLLLAAHAAGLGGCPVCSFWKTAVGRLLDLPRHMEPILLVPVGRPSHPVRPSARRSRDEVIHHDTWPAPARNTTRPAA